MNRRDALKSMGSGFGMMAFAQMLGSTALSAGTAKPVGTHFAPKTKRVIFLFLNGGPSQVDTFDPKPALEKFHGTAEPGWENGILAPGRIHQAGTLMKSPFPFKKYGQSGIEVSSLFPKVGECIDDVCVVRSMYSDIPNHPQGLFMMNCGTIGAGRPALGSWLLYGLGTVNQNLPGFVVLSPGLPIMAPQIWNSAFLPASYQGTWVNTEKADPKQLIPYIKNDRIDLSRQRQQVELLASLNQAHLKKQGPSPELEATIQGMETGVPYANRGCGCVRHNQGKRSYPASLRPGRVRARLPDVSKTDRTRCADGTGLFRSRPTVGQPHRHHGS